MKKRYLFAIGLSIVVIIYFVVVTVLNFTARANYIYSSTDSIIGLKFENVIYKPVVLVEEPYYLVSDIATLENEAIEYEPHKEYIKEDDIYRYLPPFDYFVPYCDSFDKSWNFIVVSPYDFETSMVYVKSNFRYPTIKTDSVNEIWTSLFNTNSVISDKSIVANIVECAKTKTKLDEEIYEQLNLRNGGSLFFKYDGYPLVEEFHVEETEDGRYIVDQYTASEYDSVYLEEHK